MVYCRLELNILTVHLRTSVLSRSMKVLGQFLLYIFALLYNIEIFITAKKGNTLINTNLCNLIVIQLIIGFLSKYMVSAPIQLAKKKVY